MQQQQREREWWQQEEREREWRQQEEQEEQGEREREWQQQQEQEEREREWQQHQEQEEQEEQRPKGKLNSRKARLSKSYLNSETGNILLSQRLTKKLMQNQIITFKFIIKNNSRRHKHEHLNKKSSITRRHSSSRSRSHKHECEGQNSSIQVILYEIYFYDLFIIQVRNQVIISNSL
jgi:hypothetical protein